MHIGKEADVSAHVLDISDKKTQLRGLLDTGAVLSVIPIETGANGFRQRRFDRLKNTSVSCKQRATAGTRQNTNNIPKPRGTQPVVELYCGGEPR